MWNWFIELDRARTSNGYGPNAISHLEIDAWARLYGHRLKDWELRAIRALDLERCVQLAEAARDETEGPPVSEIPMSASLFDALFSGKE